MVAQYYSHVLDLPSTSPYDRPESRFSSWIGNFVAPLRETGFLEKYWFTYYGDYAGGYVRYRAYTEHYEDFRPHVEELVKKCALTLRKEEEGLTLVGDLGHGRFLTDRRSDKEPHDRAFLVLSYLHSVAELVVDNLVDKGDGYWELEVSSDLKENPNESNFETLHHLFCNMTRVPVSVLFSKDGHLARTWWGPPTGKRKVPPDKGDFTEIYLPY